MNRLGWIRIAIGLMLVAGCGGYDRELLGDPDYAREEPPARQEEAQPEEWDVAEDPTLVPDDSLLMFEELRFYGSWYNEYPYGWVWRPVVVSTWAPMTFGHWVWTNFGWMWVSYDPWDITYNYGYWVHDFALGWIWVPGYEWSPAHCEWVMWDDYICWAPLPPPDVHYGDPWDERDTDPWVTVPLTKFKSADVGRSRVPPKFKSDSSGRTLRRLPPEPTAIERGSGGPVRTLELVLETKHVGSREFTRVVLPADEQAIVSRQRGDDTRYQTPTPPQHYNSGTTTTTTMETPNNDPPPSKSKGSSPPPAKKEEPAKFKEKARDSDKSKDSSGKSKGKGKN